MVCHLGGRCISVQFHIRVARGALLIIRRNFGLPSRGFMYMSVKLHIKEEVYTANSSKDFGLPAIGSEVYIWVEVHCQYQGDFGL